MKIIISHDVDHLYATDHIFNDLFLEKLWVRSFLQMCKGQISFKVFIYRLTIPFQNRMHRIDELMDFDEKHGVPSTFFFGMNNGLGMSYNQTKAKPIINKVKSRGFNIGVHGIEYMDFEGIKKEHDDFVRVSGLSKFGIRNHYVRFDDETFAKMEQAGYIYDSTWFNKEKVEIRNPYKVGIMWEFPLSLMDVYVCKNKTVDESVNATIAAIEDAEKNGISYFTILFHDTGFEAKNEPVLCEWYKKTIEYCKHRNFVFCSFVDAIEELEERNN